MRKRHKYTRWDGTGKRPASHLTVEVVHANRYRSLAMVSCKQLHWRMKKGEDAIVRYRIVPESEFDPTPTNHG